MKIRRDEFSGQLEFIWGKDDRHLAHFENEWRQFVLNPKVKWNWISFHVFNLYFERENMVGGFELILIILGLGFRIRWNDLTMNPEIDERLKDIENSFKVD